MSALKGSALEAVKLLQSGGASRSAALAALIELQRSLIERAEQLPPEERDLYFTTLVADLRSRRPESVSPLGALPPPGEPVRDPRGPR